MAEDNQNNEMEDILSSIKNILEEDEQKHLTEGEDNNDVVNDVINSSSEEDNILELSPDMRIEEKVDTIASDGDATADLVSEVINENTADPLADIDISTTEEANSFIASDNNSQTATEDVAISIKGLDVGSEDFESDSFFDDSEHQQGDIQVEDAPQEEIVLPEVETAPQEEIVLPEVEAAPQEEIILPEVEDAPMPDMQNDISEAAPSVEAKPKTSDAEAVDAAANIISNFAKMFSHQEPEHQAEFVSSSKAEISDVGNKDKTLEEFVLDSITKVIGKEISHQWNDGADFSQFAKEEIIRQTQVWINNNLPDLVEKVVKQEIERVIAKVGS